MVGGVKKKRDRKRRNNNDGEHVIKLSKVGGIGYLLLLPAGVWTGAAFTTTAKTCSSVKWSQDALQKYPTIGSACQDVLQRDGKSYVKFTGEVVRVIDGGQQLTIDFKSGGVFTVSPPDNMNVSINDKRTRVRDLMRGDQLSFYIPETRLAVDLFDGRQPPRPFRSSRWIRFRHGSRARAGSARRRRRRASRRQRPPQPQPVQGSAPAPAPRPAPAVVQTPAPPPPASSLATIGWVVLAVVG
jgi:hypothetical protein